MFPSVIARRPFTSDTDFVLDDVDRSVSAWLRALLPEEVAVVHEIAVGRSEVPTVYLHLHEIREDPDGSSAGWSPVRGEDGCLTGRMPPDRRYRLTYLITASAVDTLTEHHLLGLVLFGTAASDALPDDHLHGCLIDDGRSILARCAPADRNIDTTGFWSAWRILPRTSLTLTALVPLPRTLLTELAPPPREMDLRGMRREPSAAVPIPTPGPIPRHRPKIEEP